MLLGMFSNRSNDINDKITLVTLNVVLYSIFTLSITITYS